MYTLFWEEKNSQNVLHCPSCTLSNFRKLWTTLLLGPVENCPIPFLVRHSIQKLFGALDKGFKITSCVTRQMWYLHGIQIWMVIRWPLFLLIICGQSRHMQCTWSPCILLNLASENAFPGSFLVPVFPGMKQLHSRRKREQQTF